MIKTIIGGILIFGILFLVCLLKTGSWAVSLVAMAIGCIFLLGILLVCWGVSSEDKNGR